MVKVIKKRCTPRKIFVSHQKKRNSILQDNIEKLNSERDVFVVCVFPEEIGESFSFFNLLCSFYDNYINLIEEAAESERDGISFISAKFYLYKRWRENGFKRIDIYADKDRINEIRKKVSSCDLFEDCGCLFISPNTRGYLKKIIGDLK